MIRPLEAAARQFERGLRRRLASDLRGALGRGELTLQYQPRIRLQDGIRIGAEALLRWHHARRGEVPPAAFIPVAEGSDLIVALGGWVLRQATLDAAQNPALGRISINISARQILSGALPGQVDQALAASGLAPERLELELTETLALEEGPEIAAMLGTLRDRGISLAVDDFGSGYASIGRLRRLPVTTLKLDRSLVAPLPGEETDRAILRALRDLGRALGLRLVAEGVERPEQHDILVALRLDEAQGFLFGGPVALEALLRGAPAPLAPPAGTPTLPGACTRPESPSSAPALPASPAPAP